MRILALITLILLAQWATAQPELLDKVVAVVDESVILDSEIKLQEQQYAGQGYAGPNLKCDILEGLMTQKMLVAKAILDSVDVTDDQVSLELDRRMRYFVSMVGGQEAFEEYYGRTIEQYKEDFRSEVRNQVLAQTVQSRIIGDVTVSPREINEFFDKIPNDSLPLINAQVEFQQLVLYAKVGAEQERVSRAFLEDIRSQIVEEDKDFSVMAILYSQDPGSKDNGGDLSCFGRQQMVPEFEKMAFALDTGMVSPVFKSAFGYHIMQVYKKGATEVCARHILIRVSPAQSELSRLKQKMDSLVKLIKNESITFEAAVTKYSSDKSLYVINKQTGSSAFDMSELGEYDPSLATLANTLKVGQISPAHPHQAGQDKVGYRVVKLKSQTKPHELNTTDDWPKLQELTLASKKQDVFDKWMMKFKDKVYIFIAEDFEDCGSLKSRWLVQE